MRLSRAKFVLLFVGAAFAFQFASNSILGSEVRLFPARDDSFLGTGSPIAWKSAAAALLLPIKIVLLGPLLPLTPLPDLPPPFLAVGFALYWAILAALVHLFLDKMRRS